MSQHTLYVAIYVLGLSVCLAIGPRTRPHLCGALAFLVGLAIVVAIELLFLCVGIPFTPVTGWIAMGIAFAACLASLRRAWPAARTWRILAVWTVGWIMVTWFATRVNYGPLTYDSHYLILVARVIAEEGAFVPALLQRLGDYGVFQVVAQSLVGLTKLSYLWGLPPVFAVATIATFAVAVGEGLAALRIELPFRRTLIALVTFTTFSIYMVLRHAFYLQTNLPTAAYLFVFCTLFWLSEVDGDVRRLPLAFVAIFAISLQRIEGALISAVFLSLTVLPSRLSPRAIMPGLVAAATAVLAWYLILAQAMPPTSEFLTPTRCYLMASVLVVFTAYYAAASWGRRPLAWLTRVNRIAPLLIAGALVLALAFAFAARFDHMQQSTLGWFTTLLHAPYWEHAWVAIPLLALLALAVPAPPARWVFVIGIPANMAVILLLVLNRTPYYFGMGDSAARMAIHGVPLAFFYFAIKFLPLLGRQER